jgi:tetratricopeptide (TPR) repeat protein
MVFFATSELLRFFRSEKSFESNARIAVFTALIFAVHPVHVEAVTWLSARKEVLLGFFFFASLYSYLRATGEPGKVIRAVFYTLASLCFVLAALSKPVAVVLPGIVVLFEFARGKIELTRLLKRTLWFVPLLLFTLGVIFILLKVMVESGGIYPYWGGGFLSNILVSFYLVILNIKLVALTVNYCNIYILTIPESLLWLGLFLLPNAGLVALAVFMRKRSRVVFFAVIWFYITLLPFLNIIPISTLLADRYLLIASFAYCLVVALGLERLWSVTRKDFSKDFFPALTTAILIVLLAGYAYMTVSQNRVWKNSYTLWLDAAAKQGETSSVMNSLGVLYLDGDMDEEALEALEKAVRANPTDPLAHNNLGIAYLRLGEYERSEHHYLRALSLKPDFYKARINLGILSEKKGDFDEAISVFVDILADRPEDSWLHHRLGYTYEMAGQLEEAIGEYKRSIELTPHIITPYESLGRLYMEKLNDHEKAIYFFEKGIEIAPDSRKAKDLEAMINRLQSR